MENQELKHTKVTGFIKVIKVVLYKNHPVYLRMLGESIFEYLLIHEGEIYSSYISISPREGETELSNADISMSADLIYTGAEATIDSLLGEVLNDKDKKIAETFEEHREVVEEKNG